MKFSGLSESEVQLITSILGNANIPFEVIKDIDMEQFNDLSLKNNLRYFSSPNISTNILCIEISEDAFSNLSNEVRLKLLDFGITNEIPEEIEIPAKRPRPVQENIIKGTNRVIAVYAMMAIVVPVVIYFIINLF